METTVVSYGVHRHSAAEATIALFHFSHHVMRHTACVDEGSGSRATQVAVTQNTMLSVGDGTYCTHPQTHILRPHTHTHSPHRDTHIDTHVHTHMTNSSALLGKDGSGLTFACSQH